MKYDQLRHLRETLNQRLEGSEFISFIAPKNDNDFQSFIKKAEAIAHIKNDSIDIVLDNPETNRNLLDQVATEELELYVKSTKEGENFLGSLDEYRQKFSIGALSDLE